MIAALILALGPVFVPAAPRAPPPPKPRTPCARGCLSPQEAINFANQLAPRAGVAGEFELTVKAVGVDKGLYYLNSEDDYRDQRNVTIALSPAMANLYSNGQALESLRRRFVGKHLAVLGIALRTRINFTSDNLPTGKYYYQTHIRVGSPEQIAELAD